MKNEASMEFNIDINTHPFLKELMDNMILQEKIRKEHALYVSQVKYAEIHNFFPS